MNHEQKTILASLLILTSLTSVIVASALSLRKPAYTTPYVPDPVTQRELSIAKNFAKNKDWKKAAEILSRNAVGSNVQAKYEYAMLHVKGWGVPRDLEKARNLLLQAVQRPFKDRAKAAFELGRVYRMSKGEDCFRIAFEWFNKSVQWGYMKAHNELGKSYARGIGVDQDIELALKHYRIAATHNSTSAVLPLIELLAKGSSTVSANPKMAAAIFNEFMPKLEVAAKAGDARAARCIGRLYQNGLIVEPNSDKALKWLSIAAGLGDAIAMHDMAVLIIETKKEFASKKDVVGLLSESIKRDYAAAITTFGRLHLKSKFGLPERKAVALFKQGTLAGHPGSMEELGRLYLNGKYVEYDINKARDLAEQGSRLKHSGSRKLLEKIMKIEAEKSSDTSAVSLAGRG